MNTANTNADKLKEFKAKFTKELIVSVFTTTSKAIGFYEYELSLAKIRQKETDKAFLKENVFVRNTDAMFKNYPRIHDLKTLFEISVREVVKNETELLQLQIDHLKTIK